MAKRKKSSPEKNNLKDIFFRYAILILAALPGFSIFYSIFRPLTVYPVYWLLGIFYEVSLIDSISILIKSHFLIELISACIAGSAYYLLLVLNLSTPNIKNNKRLKMIFYAFAVFLVLNISRIFVLAFLAYSGSSFFDVTHRFFWYFLSTIFVVVIWFFQVRNYKIKDIPFYSDIKSIKNLHG